MSARAVLCVTYTLLLPSATVTDDHEIDSFQQYQPFPRGSGAKKTGIKELAGLCLLRRSPGCPSVLAYGDTLQSLSLSGLALLSPCLVLSLEDFLIWDPLLRFAPPPPTHVL